MRNTRKPVSPPQALLPGTRVPMYATIKEDLKERLDTYINKNGLKLYLEVEKALEQYLNKKKS